ncbi:Uncharacterised protein [Legionella busanensis]|uniref:Nuclear transport factor 2 family protein n=1 Tax=Legionella busanensis TaxID=190655 RepID=A0A378JMA7_9GAMM|nr:hypothetical protein [Legionella busanensis]STX52354.1 Uncharacterised protein [Legionella busanensis]
MKKSKVQNFINGYADAVLKTDIENIASHFHNQFVLSTQKDSWYIENDYKFQINLAKSFEGYKKLGADVCKLIRFELVTFNSNHCLANLKWSLIDCYTNPLVDFDISYFIKEMDGHLKFVFVIDHNEIERITTFQRNQR